MRQWEFGAGVGARSVERSRRRRLGDSPLHRPRTCRPYPFPPPRSAAFLDVTTVTSESCELIVLGLPVSAQYLSRSCVVDIAAHTEKRSRFQTDDLIIGNIFCFNVINVLF